MMTKESISVQPAAEADPVLAKLLSEWFESEFGRRADRWAAPDHHVLLYVGGQIAGQLGVLDTKVSVRGEIIRVGGIGGVATKPEFRRRGVASAMLSRAADFMRSDLGVGFGFLLCAHEVSPVYTKMGWTIVPGPTTFTRKGVAATYLEETMILRLAKKEWPPGAIDMLGLPW